MSTFSKIPAKNQKEMLKVVAPTSKIQNNPLNIEDTDSETENVLPTNTSTPVKTKTTTRKSTSIASRNRRLCTSIEKFSLVIKTTLI